MPLVRPNRSSSRPPAGWPADPKGIFLDGSFAQLVARPACSSTHPQAVAKRRHKLPNTAAGNHSRTPTVRLRTSLFGTRSPTELLPPSCTSGITCQLTKALEICLTKNVHFLQLCFTFVFFCCFRCVLPFFYFCDFLSFFVIFCICL